MVAAGLIEAFARFGEPLSYVVGVWRASHGLLVLHPLLPFRRVDDTAAVGKDDHI